MKKTGLLIIALAAFSVGAIAQLGGVVRSTTGAAGSAQGNRGGLAGDLGVDHTLNGTLGAGRNSVDLGADSTLNGTAKADNSKVRETAKQKKEKSKQTVADTTAKTKQKVETTAQATEQKAEQAASSTSVSSSTDAKASSNASQRGHDASANGTLGLVNAVNASVAGHDASANASSDASVSAEMKHEHQNSAANHGAAAGNTNSGDAKLHGLDRAESRVENNTNAETMLQRNEQRQESDVKVFSDTKGSAKVKKTKKRD